MKYSTVNHVLIQLYRAIAIVLVSMPLILPIIVKADVVTSLIYSPLFSLFLAFFLLDLDKKLNVLIKSESGGYSSQSKTLIKGKSFNCGFCRWI